MKRYANLFFVIGLTIISLGLYVLLLCLHLPKGMDVLWFFLLQIAGILFIIPFFVIFHEFGHFVFGKMTGYRLSSFKFVVFEWRRHDDNKLHFHRNAFIPGILGQCLMYPPKPQKKKKTPFFMYNAGGLVFSYFLLILLAVLYFVISNSYVKWILLPMLFLSFFFCVSNSKYSSQGFNDVCNAVFIKKHPEYLDSIMYQLEMMGNLLKGKRYGAKCLYHGYVDKKANHLSLPVAQFRFYAAIDHNNFKEAKEMADIMSRSYSNLIMVVQRLAVSFELLWADIVLDRNMNKFKRHLMRFTEIEKKLCQKKDTDVHCYYEMYTAISHGKYDIKSYIEKLCSDEMVLPGEKLSMQKRFSFLEEALKEYEENGFRFISEGVKL